MPSSPTVHIDQALANPDADKRLQILGLIGGCGSISEAARRAGVSYKAAWQAVDTLSNLAGTPLVEKAVGGSGGGGARLTAAGEHLLQAAALMAQAQHQVLTQLGGAHGSPGAVLPGLALRTSMRNQLPCAVAGMRPLGGMTIVRLRLADGLEMAAQLTRESVQLLGLAKGLPVLALFKATAVRIARADGEPPQGNRLEGRVTRVGRASGACEVALALPNGASVVGFAPAGTSLRKGMLAGASVEASSVVIGLWV